MSRLIDADALKQALVEFMDAFIDSDGDMMYSDHLLIDADYMALCNFIDTQPIVTPEPHWIPCSEELPKVKQKVLVQYADGSMATKRCNDAGHLAWFYSNAVAWMPAPEPYKGVTE